MQSKNLRLLECRSLPAPRRRAGAGWQLGLLGLALLASGCSLFRQPAADAKVAAELSILAYPQAAPLGEDLDILVVTHHDRIQLVNRTARSYENVQLWLNQQWVGQVERIAIGTGNKADLQKFINRHSEPFPYGAFFHPDQAFPIVLAEIYDPQTRIRHRLISRQAGL